MANKIAAAQPCMRCLLTLFAVAIAVSGSFA